MTEPSRRDLLTLAAALAASPALTASPALAQPAAAPDVTAVALATPLGRIVVALETTRAALTSANFLRYVDGRRFDGAASFFRASRPKGSTRDDFGLIEGGLAGHPEKLLAPIAHESTLQTGLSHLDGTISLARNAPGTGQADFFICLGRQTYLDATPTEPGFAAFGRVTEGLEIARQILVMPTDPEKGEGAMKGEMLASPVPIITARRL
jgi:peptidyl-prolyl cis-trans isomerase A (cyclophilin A)